MKLSKLQKLYPDIQWQWFPVDKEITDSFGSGKMLRGTKNGRFSEFFLPMKLKDKLYWAGVIVRELNEQ